MPFEPGVIQLAPTTDPLGLVLGAYEATREREGSLLVLVPTDGWADATARPPGAAWVRGRLVDPPVGPRARGVAGRGGRAGHGARAGAAASRAP